jgi:hypothetical protein
MPNLRNYLTSAGTTTTDSTLVSGARNPLSTNWVATVPAAALPPGQYAIWARLRSSTTGTNTVSWSTKAQSDLGAQINGSPASGSASPSLDLTWKLCPIGRAMLPGVLLPDNTNANVVVTLSGTAGIDIDDAWLFNVTTGALTVVSKTNIVGPGSTPNGFNLWVDTADSDYPMPTVWRGHAPDRSDSYGTGAYAQAWGSHVLWGTRRAFVVTTGAPNPVVTAEYFPRWHTHAAK